MRLCWSVVITCVCTAFVAGRLTDSDELTPLESVTLHAGDDLPILVQTLPDEVAGCYLVTPFEERIQFLPVDMSSDKFELNSPNLLSGCQVTIRSLNEKDSGIWQLYYTTEDTDGRFNVRRSQYYSVIVKPKESDNVLNSIEDESDEDDIPITLPTIRYGARKGINISITLSKQDYEEECYLQTPQGLVVKLEDAQIDGVQVFPTSSDFVACRIVIGPMEASLLGTWMLCGKHMDGHYVHERCQPGDISWTSDNPSANWYTTTHPNFDHVVHYGFQLAPIVRGTGTVNTCHVVTPTGEDIVVTPESDYPGFQRVAFNSDVAACSVTISVKDASYLGNWVLYGTFHSITMGFNVVSLPMTFFLYDQNNPFNQAYNVTQLDTQTHVIREGHTITVEVVGAGHRDDCKIITNNDETYDETTISETKAVTFINDDMPACRLQIGPVAKSMFGKWRLIGKFNSDNLLFNEFQLPLNIVEEDPANPHPDDIERTIHYYGSQHVNAPLGSAYTFTTHTGAGVVTDSCHVRTPDYMQYILRPEESHSTFEAVVLPTISCGVQVRVDSEDAIGDWLLIARLTVNGVPIEQRLPFTIHVEEKVTAVPNVTTIAEGNDLYVRLENPTSLFPTCTLTGPVRNNADQDEKYIENCGFIVRELTLADAGTWEIIYGNKIKYRAEIQVDITERFGSNNSSILTWTKDSSVNETIGPNDAIYCKVEDPSGTTVVQGLGPCNIAVERVGPEHEGIWRATIGTSGRILTDTLEFVVKVSAPDSKPKVATSVVTEKPSVTLSCQVASEHEVTACKFRDPTGKVLLTTQGVGEGRYSSQGVGVRSESNVTRRECSLRIMNPVATDLGLWRCVIETELETYFGFLTVLSPWTMQDPHVAAAVVTEPTLTADTPTISAVEEDAVTMRCSVQSAIRYCYFRSRNGTIYNVGPGTSNGYEYAGAGLDSGECSIRFSGLHAEDSGTWSCHVGFYTHTEPEQRTTIQVQIEALMSATQNLLPDRPDTLVVSGQVYKQRALEYCRFVRIDGQGFISGNIYEDYSVLANGKCEIRIRNPNVLELHPWTVVAKIVGREAELARSTEHSLRMTDEPRRAESSFMIVWSVVLVISLTLFLVGLLLGPKRSREWTYRRAAIVRNGIRQSFRHSFIKKPLPETPGNTREHTPTAA